MSTPTSGQTGIFHAPEKPPVNAYLEVDQDNHLFLRVRRMVADIHSEDVGNVVARQYLREDKRLTKEQFDGLVVAMARALGLKRARCLKWHLNQARRAHQALKDREASLSATNGQLFFDRPREPWDIQIEYFVRACQLARNDPKALKPVTKSG